MQLEELRAGGSSVETIILDGNPGEMFGANAMALSMRPAPDAGSFGRLHELGVELVSQQFDPGRAAVAYRVVETDKFARWCRGCGCQAERRDSMTPRPVH
ncbi:hypothetical protein [Arthrobacter glacialis]|uniref:hypothetical protein n=1 Tax=Arthrobacter glacialis TaxID=1664 RepID=UPI003C2B2574